ncbi:MAG: hypothetical protein JJT94_08410 [Bernardetiaceae bacterium]|nr:hypothetical protein [Bernardetiaceae bacterium]
MMTKFKQFSFYSALIWVSLWLLLLSCGTVTEVYRWDLLRVNWIERLSGASIPKEDSLHYIGDVALQVRLSPRIIGEYNSGAFLPPGRDLQSNNRIDSIRISSLGYSVADSAVKDSVITTDFLASYLNETEEQAISVRAFVRLLGRREGIIDEGFILYPTHPLPFPNQRLVIQLNLSDRRTLYDTTSVIRVLD